MSCGTFFIHTPGARTACSRGPYSCRLWTTRGQEGAPCGVRAPNMLGPPVMRGTTGSIGGMRHPAACQTAAQAVEMSKGPNPKRIGPLDTNEVLRVPRAACWSLAFPYRKLTDVNRQPAKAQHLGRSSPCVGRIREHRHNLHRGGSSGCAPGVDVPPALASRWTSTGPLSSGWGGLSYHLLVSLPPNLMLHG